MHFYGFALLFLHVLIRLLLVHGLYVDGPGGAFIPQVEHWWVSVCCAAAKYGERCFTGRRYNVSAVLKSTLRCAGLLTVLYPQVNAKKPGWWTVCVPVPLCVCVCVCVWKSDLRDCHALSLLALYGGTWVRWDSEVHGWGWDYIVIFAVRNLLTCTLLWMTADSVCVRWHREETWRYRDRALCQDAGSVCVCVYIYIYRERER